MKVGGAGIEEVVEEVDVEAILELLYFFFFLSSNFFGFIFVFFRPLRS